MPINVELTRFRVKEGKSQKVDEWLAFLNDHMEDSLLTLEGEKMYVETNFREILDGREYLYWYSVQGKVAVMSRTRNPISISSTWPTGWSASILNLAVSTLRPRWTWGSLHCSWYRPFWRRSAQPHHSFEKIKRALIERGNRFSWIELIVQIWDTVFGVMKLPLLSFCQDFLVFDLDFGEVNRLLFDSQAGQKV